MPTVNRKVSVIAERGVQIFALLFAVLYLVSGILYLCLDYWPVTESDFWQIYHVSLNHSWLQSALLKFNNHSLFFPSFIWLADLHFFHGSQVFIFACGLALLTISTLLLLLPIWRQPALDFTGKCLGTLTIIFGSYWMGRGATTTSGGFNCIASFALLGAAASFLLLPNISANSPHRSRTTTLLIGAGVVATFSFGSGIALWPCLLFLGWSLRLPWKSLGILLLAAVSAVVIYRLLPPAGDASLLIESFRSHRPSAVIFLKHVCWVIGAPIFHAVIAWQGVKPSPALVESSGWLFWGGAAGFLCALTAIALQVVQRKLKGNSMEFIGLGLVSFNLGVVLLVVASRVERFAEFSTDPVAPRYLFWTSLFWAGLLLLGLHYTQRSRWLRWPCILLVFVFCVAGWQVHVDEGRHWRYSRFLATESATTLLNGVADPQTLLASNQEEEDLLAPELRARGLDVFATGLHDWIGQPVTSLFGGREDERRFGGRAAMQRLSGGRDQENAVKVSGRLQVEPGRRPQQNMIIVDPAGTVVGIARSFASDEFLNRWLFGGRMPNGVFVGYIRNYAEGIPYVLRAAGPDAISRQKIVIAPIRTQVRAK